MRETSWSPYDGVEAFDELDESRRRVLASSRLSWAVSSGCETSVCQSANLASEDSSDSESKSDTDLEQLERAE